MGSPGAATRNQRRMTVRGLMGRKAHPAAQGMSPGPTGNRSGHAATPSGLVGRAFLQPGIPAER